MPSLRWSAHWLATQVSDTASQAFDTQSASIWHLRPVLQGLQVPPPQSVSVSRPSFFWSKHVLEAHLPVTLSHALVVQSELRVHPLPTPQAEQVPPPQSTSVSLPSCALSEHWVESHTCATASQAWLTQSLSTRHFWFTAHFAGQTPPPQSTSVSVPSSR